MTNEIDDYGILGNQKHISDYEKAIWNAAIEKAAKLTEAYSVGVSSEIRKLKK